ncbi:MAG: ABC transporter permease, partial [Lachnospiraceae bacterium]|nr:ABC transporter permease [Lachnospiraceae bacterium]
DALGELLVGTILIVLSLTKGFVIVDASHILLFVVSILAGALIYTAIKLLFASFAFWMKVSGPVLYTAYQLADFAKYPTEIYAKGVRFIITWIIPFGFVAYLPASYFLKPDVSALGTIGVECLLAAVFFAVAYLVFVWGTKVYESAGN